MKKLLTIAGLAICLPVSLFGKCSADTFYQGVHHLSGKHLSSKLSSLLARHHKMISYDGLHKAYKKTDIDRHYDNDGTILDMYSELPNNYDPYEYKPGKKVCGEYKREGDCYNREHLFPQGLFGKRKPMKSDIFHVFPTDGKVNNRRGSLPFGEVVTERWHSENGSKVGTGDNFGYQGRVFEPIDEFKGDIARAMLYFLVRYKSVIVKIKGTPMVRYKSYSDWFLRTMIKWHKQDPVSEFEKNRNNIACNYQKNRNPFIDHPEWVDRIWGKDHFQQRHQRGER